MEGTRAYNLDIELWKWANAIDSCARLRYGTMKYVEQADLVSLSLVRTGVYRQITIIDNWMHDELVVHVPRR